jgi:hypothetical protein
MKTWSWLVALITAILLSANGAWADGDFYVVAIGGAATRITSVPYIITKPGFYYFTGNLTYSGTGDAISIRADNVILDLMGFSLTGAGKTISSCGINPNFNYNDIACNNVEIRNGTVSGFGAGVVGAGASERVNRITALNNTYGIWVAGGNPSIEGCTCSSNDRGILVGSGWIANCIANNNTDWGINLNGPGAMVACVANNNNGTGFVLAANGPTPMMVDQNSASGNDGFNYNSGSNTNIAWGTNVGR